MITPASEQQRLADALARLPRPVGVRLNRNRRLLVSLRMEGGKPIVSVHEGLLQYPDALDDLIAWIARGGRGRHPVLRQAMRTVFDQMQAQQRQGVDVPALPPLPTVGVDPLPLDLWFNRIHGTWFAHVPRPSVGWSRSTGNRPQQHIRFGCYRQRPSPLITLHPKLALPWVAVCFVEHVIFHELCHHAQACRPIRGETAHSDRFRSWERRYPQHELALAWEKAHLHRFLNPSS